MGLKRDFAAAVKEHFLAMTPPLDEELSKIASATYSKPTAFLLFEYDSPQFSKAFAVSVWPMNRKGKPTAERHRLLPRKAVV